MKIRARAALRLILVGAGVFLVVKFVAAPYIVVGDSMSPTLKSWDLCLMPRVYHYRPRRGDIVMFRTADDPPLYFIKRVIGLPNETVAMEHGIIKVNGATLPEPYATVNPEWEVDATMVPPDKVFVVGDNRDLPEEDYVFGLVSTRLVKARLFWHWRWKQ